MSSNQSNPVEIGGEVFDCADCGACCRCYPIFASARDAEREPLLRERCVKVDNFLGKGEVAYRMYPLANTEGCAFLGSDQLCRIYGSRPELCRRFESGSEQCRHARNRVGVGRGRNR
ncbi:YkgJ family cysteine cluster protein [Pelagicoccus sp. SDUM812002]|uniref:YkgJ family cysteine cluster protein n=1 Tax=Pelagicoccus sp. SDUM812002 TaxID=3041266 RepID=UPI0031F325C8